MPLEPKLPTLWSRVICFLSSQLHDFTDKSDQIFAGLPTTNHVGVRWGMDLSLCTRLTVQIPLKKENITYNSLEGDNFPSYWGFMRCE
jgi:hypothetical protein